MKRSFAVRIFSERIYCSNYFAHYTHCFHVNCPLLGIRLRSERQPNGFDLFGEFNWIAGCSVRYVFTPVIDHLHGILLNLYRVSITGIMSSVITDNPTVTMVTQYGLAYFVAFSSGKNSIKL